MDGLAPVWQVQAAALVLESRVTQHSTTPAPWGTLPAADAAAKSAINLLCSLQWFGDTVTFAHWGSLWLAEGPATYFENVGGEAAVPGSAFLDRFFADSMTRFLEHDAASGASHPLAVESGTRTWRLHCSFCLAVAWQVSRGPWSTRVDVSMMQTPQLTSSLVTLTAAQRRSYLPGCDENTHDRHQMRRPSKQPRTTPNRTARSVTCRHRQ